MEGRSASLLVGSRRRWGGARYTKLKYRLLLLIVCLVPRRLKCGKRKTRLHEPSWCIAQWTMRAFSMNAKDAGKGGREKWDASQIWFDFSPENSDFWIWAVNRSRCAILRRNNVAQIESATTRLGTRHSYYCVEFIVLLCKGSGSLLRSL